MIKTPLFIIALVIAFPFSSSYAEDEKTINAQRRDAQKQRQQLKNERNKSNSEALRGFRQFARSLKTEFKQKARALDTAFKLRKVDLNAEHQSRVAAAEAELQQSMTNMMLGGQNIDQQATLDKFRADLKAHSDKIYQLRKQAARAEHEAMIENELEKHRLLTQRDQQALDEARSLGLLDRPGPILATAIGDGLDKNEQRWNEREQKEVEKLYKNNQRPLAEFVSGSKLREWEIQNRRDDFTLEWQKNDELQALNGENNFYNLFLPQLATGDEANQQEVANRIAEISKQNKLINIKYRKIKDKTRIRRNEQKKKILGH